MRYLSFATTLTLLALCGVSARAQDTSGVRPPARVVTLRNGENDVDILGNGTPGRIFVSWRGNFNAHGFSAVAFYVRAPSDLGPERIWQLVPFFGGPNDKAAGEDLFTTGEGADCTLGDLRVVRHPRGPVEVVIAWRELGESFADPAPVRFDFYTLAHNDDAVPGWPPFYFKFTRSVPASRPYCDVNEAFMRELHLGARGLGNSEQNP